MPDNGGAAVAIILARGGSKGVPRKNLRTVGGVSLVGRSVIAARGASCVEAVYVSTDDESIADEARRYGARVVKRPADLSGDAATSESGWMHALGEARGDFPLLDRLVLLQCTSPFTTPGDIEGCLAAMDEKGADCALSVIDAHAFLWTVGADGFGEGVNHDETRQRERRQDLPPSYQESGAIYCVRVDAFERIGRRFCGAVALYPVDHPPIDIDTPADLELCNLIARNREASEGDLTARLRAVKAIVTDFDGVMTDDAATVDQNGVESVRVSRRDGLGVEFLRRDGRARFLILSKEKNPVVSRRAEKLKVDCLQARDDKVGALSDWLREAGIDWTDIIFVGNDVNDLGALEKAGISACPSDAHPAVARICDWIIPVRGGDGVIRAVAERYLGDG